MARKGQLTDGASSEYSIYFKHTTTTKGAQKPANRIIWSCLPPSSILPFEDQPNCPHSIQSSALQRRIAAANNQRFHKSVASAAIATPALFMVLVFPCVAKTTAIAASSLQHCRRRRTRKHIHHPSSTHHPPGRRRRLLLLRTRRNVCALDWIENAHRTQHPSASIISLNNSSQVCTPKTIHTHAHTDWDHSVVCVCSLR